MNYFKNLKFVLKLIGTTIADQESLIFKVYSLSILFSSCFYVANSIKELFKLDFETLLDTLHYEMAITVAFIKMLFVSKNRGQIGKIMEKLERRPFLPNPKRGGPKELTLIRECISITKLQEKIYGIAACASMVLTNAITVMKRVESNNFRDWEFPYGPITLVNVTYSPNYEIALSYQLVTATCFGACFVVTDLTAAAILAHISYQFKILRNNISNIINISYEDMFKDSRQTSKTSNSKIEPSVIPWKYLKKNLADVVEYHLSIIEITDEFENVFSALLLLVFVCSLGMVAFMLYHLTMIPLSDNRIYEIILACLCACLQTFIVCYWGEQVLTESQLVGNSAFDINFVETDLRFQKGLQLIICRSQKPVVVTAKKFTVINLHTFSWILRNSYSTYMVLQNQSE